MKPTWMNRYENCQDKDRKNCDVLVGFNANLDRVVSAEEFAIDETPMSYDAVENMQEFMQELSYGDQERINEEVDLEFDPELEKGELQIGGQAGIMSNYLSAHGHGVIFYTPLLSEELASKLNEKILYPVMDGDFVLKNVRDASTTDRTKENIIVEFENGKTSRIIFSQKLRGFGPYFRKGVEDHLEQLENGFDRAIVSGFHDSDGNIESKIKKSSEQLSKIDKPVHLEFVHREKTDELVLDYIVPEIDSIGLDENETLQIADKLGMDIEELNLGDAYQVGSRIIDRYGVSRVAIHTYRYHATITDESYEIESEEIRDGMLYGELCAIAMADSGEISSESHENLDFDNLHLHSLQELEHFEDAMSLRDFTSTGIADLEDKKIVAIPTLIHEDPERLVGMGDVISSGSFIGEIS